ncbi:MAG: HEAT repeat domain-containing protein [bacterium]|nr:HEAT repeat domain-containing protein [bacterium]MBU1917888.1 HEAT repeat domain-containing protein [bacterium]
MQQRKTILFITITLTILVLVSVIVYKNTQTSFPFDPQETCSFKSGDKLDYDISANMDLDLAILSQNKNTQTLIEGSLHLLALKSKNQSTTIKAQFSDLEYIINEKHDRLRAKNLSQPLFFDITNDCHVSHFRFSKNITKTDALIVKNIIQEMQLNLPDDQKTNSWETRQTNTMGTYTAHYAIEAADDTNVTLQKNKQKYTAINTQMPNAQTTSDIKSSHFEITLSRQTPWIESMIGTEELLVQNNNEPFMKAITHFKITLTNYGFQDVLNQPLSEDAHTTLEEFEKQPQKKDYQAVYPIDNIQNRDWDSILSEFSASMNADTPADKRKALDLMVQYVNHVKGGAQSLIQAIKEGSLEKAHQSRAFLALELAGNNEAQTALSQVIDNEQFDNMNRMRAMIALQDVPSPKPEAVQTLFDQANLFGSTENNQDIASTALLTLGTLAGKNKNTQPEYLSQVKNTVLKSLETETNPDNKALYLTALGNTKDPDLSTTVSSYLDDASDMVRSAAAKTLGSMPTPENEITLNTQLTTETSSDVKLWTLKSLNKYENPSQDTLSTIARTVHNEPNKILRKEMIKILGKQAKKNQDARDALVDLQKTESNNQNLELIGSYL